MTHGHPELEGEPLYLDYNADINRAADLLAKAATRQDIS